MRVFSLLAASVALGLSSCSKEPHISGAKAPPVVTVRRDDRGEAICHRKVIGTVRANRAAVEAKVIRPISRMAGSRATGKKGDLIAEIDAGDQGAAGSSARHREQAGQDLSATRCAKSGWQQNRNSICGRFRVADAAVRHKRCLAM
jgi:hypothetical protein